MAKNQFLNGEKVLKTAQNPISRKKLNLFDFTTFFAWTFLNVLAFCEFKKYFCTTGEKFCESKNA